MHFRPMEVNPGCLGFVSLELREDPELVLLAVLRNPGCLHYRS